MALLIFPPNPVNGQLYPTNPLAGQYQYQWDAADVTWRLLGAATGVAPGTYCPSTTSVPRFTVDATGRITNVQCVELDYVKLNNSSAYNNYIWPNADGGAGDVLVTDGTGTLSWIPQSGGGGGGGVSFVGAGIGLSTVSGLPITTTGTINLDPATYVSLGGVIPDGTTITVDAAGVISASALPPLGFDLALDNGFIKLNIPTVSPAPAAGTGQFQAMPGSLYWDSTLGELFIYYFDGVNGQWVSTTGSAQNLPAGLGISITSGYTKVAIPTQSPGPAPGIGQGQAEPGSLYWDSTLGELFIYYDDGTTAQWVSTTGSSAPLPTPGFGLVLQSGIYKTSVPALNFPPTVSTVPTDAVDGSMYYDTFLGAMFYRYNDGFTSQWVQI